MNSSLVYSTVELELEDWQTVMNEACEWRRSVSGEENAAELAQNRVQRSGAWSGCGRKRWCGSRGRTGKSRSENGAMSGLNRHGAHSPLQPNISLTYMVYGKHSTVCSLLFQSSLFYSSYIALALSLVQSSNPVQPFTYCITQLKEFLARPNPSRRHDAFWWNVQFKR